MNTPSPFQLGITSPIRGIYSAVFIPHLVKGSPPSANTSACPALLSCLHGCSEGVVSGLPLSGKGRPIQTGIAASISQPSLSSSSALWQASSDATSMRRNLSPWLQYSLVNPITAGAPGCRQAHVDPFAPIKQRRRTCEQLLILSRCLPLPSVVQTLESIQLLRWDDNRTHQPPLRNGSGQSLLESPL